jgi:hypothetical protein
VEFEDAWLEVRACAGGHAERAGESMLAVQAVSEVLEAAANANRHPGMWDYSRRLGAGELELVHGAISFSSRVEDGRSVSLSADVSYKGSCYNLTLFAIKRSQ